MYEPAIFTNLELSTHNLPLHFVRSNSHRLQVMFNAGDGGILRDSVATMGN